MPKLKCLKWTTSVGLEEYLHYQKSTSVIIGKQGCYKLGNLTWIETYIHSLPGRDPSRNGELVAFEYDPKQFNYTLEQLNATEFDQETTQKLQLLYETTKIKSIIKAVNLSKSIRALRFSKYQINQRRRQMGIPPRQALRDLP